MNHINITENIYFDFLPHRRLSWYIMILVDLISIFALLLTGETYLWILVILLSLAIMPGIYNLLRISKRQPHNLDITAEQDKITFKYNDQKATISKDVIKAILMQPDTLDGKKIYE